jgi:flagella basal body P-ring formation protein FlgA
MMKLAANLLIALFFVVSGADDAAAAVLRPSVTVDADVVRLGDLFADVGKKRNSIVAAAPAPGTKTVFNAARLLSIARLAGISWRPQSRHQNTVVTRSGRLVSSADITSLIRASLIASGMPEDYQIALSRNNFTLSIAAGDDRDVRIAQSRYNPQNRQFWAVAEVPDDAASYRRIQVTGSIFEVVSVPVLARSVRRGETIRRRDLEFIKKRRSTVARNTVVDAGQIVGKTPRRYLQTGKPVMATDLRMPVLVERGKLVTLLFQNPHMVITAQGKALEDGAEGEVIRVTNTRSRQTVQGVVMGHNRVAIRLAGTTR